MARIEIYTSPTCGYCHMAKTLLRRKGASFEEIDVVRQPEKRQEMLGRSAGRRTVPQIFIDGVGIGGSDDLHALDRAGKLDAMLGA